jgi:undecaprenyl pyrophosphate phosphatase UppP
MSRTTSGPRTSRSSVFSRVDAWFFGLLAAELATFPFVPFLPLAIGIGALATPLRRSRSRIAILIVVGALLAAIIAAPFVIGALNLTLVDEGPVRHP